MQCFMNTHLRKEANNVGSDAHGYRRVSRLILLGFGNVFSVCAGCNSNLN
jgi:hypothetical protein